MALEQLEQVCGDDMRPLGMAYDVVVCDQRDWAESQMRRADHAGALEAGLAQRLELPDECFAGGPRKHIVMRDPLAEFEGWGASAGGVFAAVSEQCNYLATIRFAFSECPLPPGCCAAQWKSVASGITVHQQPVWCCLAPSNVFALYGSLALHCHGAFAGVRVRCLESKLCE